MGKHFQQGAMLFHLGRYREAIDALTEELNEQPGSAVAYAMRAAAWINLGRTRYAANDVREALRSAPELAYAHYILSFVRANHGHMRGAEGAIREALRLDPSADYFFRLAELHFIRGRFNDCREVLDNALAIDPFHAGSLMLRAKTLAAVGLHDEARNCLHSVLAQNPENPAAHHALGSLTLQAGNSVEALDSLREARRLNPIKHNDRHALAAAYGRLLKPFRIFDRYLIRYQSWTPALRWFLLAGTATWLLLLVNLLESNKLLLVPLYLLVFNLIIAPMSFELLSIAFGKIMFRRDLDIAWYRLLPEAIRIVFPVLIHLMISGMALLCAYQPTFALLFLCFVPNVELIVVLIRKSSIIATIAGGVIAFFFIFIPIGMAAAFSIDSSQFLTVLTCWNISLVFSYLLSVYWR
jgi:tetratricopeptide (TPR) repeat protein